MSHHIRKDDLRIAKTKRSLCNAMPALLKHQNFRKITVGDMCEKALISRATFYAHYADKYSVLKYWLESLFPDNAIGEEDTYENIEKLANQFANENKSIIKNLLQDADHETLAILFDFILSYFHLSIDSANEKVDPKYVVLSNFFAGGMICYLTWHVDNKFQFQVMNTFLHDLIKNFQDWNSKK